MASIARDAKPMRRITVSLDDALEEALEQAPRRLGLESDAPDAERLRAYARLGYLHTLEAELDEERLATYRIWADDPELVEVARAMTRLAAQQGVFED
ncbi:MAG TPA: hypothetical protein VFN99_01330 [Gaiella sp.]|nr:hypothetical protein [Gaiella sp.]